MRRKDLPKAGEKRGNWQIKDSRVVYENQWMRVREDKVIRPDGNDGIYGIVEVNPGVIIVVMDDAGKTLIYKNYQYGAEKVTNKLVSGGMDEGEDALSAAKRELSEETGYVAEEWIDLGLSEPFTAVINSPTQVFMARKLTSGTAHLEATEVFDLKWVPFEEAIEMVRRDEITESVSVVALFKAKMWMENSS